MFNIFKKKKTKLEQAPKATAPVNPVAAQKPAPKATEAYDPGIPAKQLRSQRTAGRGAERADGRWCTPADMRRMAACGCNLEVAFAGKLKDID